MQHYVEFIFLSPVFSTSLFKKKKKKKVRCIEAGVDPHGSFGILPQVAVRFMWWTSYLAGFYCVVLLLLVW